METNAWRKATRSMSNGACVEVGAWRKASFSNSQGACVEVADGKVIAIRDTTDRDGGTLYFSPQSWQEFTASLRTA